MPEGPLGVPRPFADCALEIGIQYSPRDDLSLDEEKTIENQTRSIFGVDAVVSTTHPPSMPQHDGGWLTVLIDEKSFMWGKLERYLNLLDDRLEEMGYEMQDKDGTNLQIV